MRRALIDPAKCVGCDECQVGLKCENKVLIRENVSDKPWINFYNCMGCMKCLNYCPNDAIIKIVRPCSNQGSVIGW